MVEIKLRSGQIYDFNTIKSVKIEENKTIEIIAKIEQDGEFKTFLLATDSIDKKSLKKLLKYQGKERLDQFFKVL